MNLEIRNGDLLKNQPLGLWLNTNIGDFSPFQIDHDGSLRKTIFIDGINKEKYVLQVDTQVEPSFFLWQLDYLKYLNENGIPTQAPFIYERAKKMGFGKGIIALYPFISGSSYANTNEADRQQAMTVIRDEIFLAGRYNYSSYPKVDLSNKWWSMATYPYEKNVKYLLTGKVDKDLKDQILNINSTLVERLIAPSREGLLGRHMLHFDLRSPHLIFNEGKLVNIIDWGSAHLDVAIFELWRPLVDLFQESSHRKQFLKLVFLKQQFNQFEINGIPYVPALLEIIELIWLSKIGTNNTSAIERQEYKVKKAIELIDDLKGLVA